MARKYIAKEVKEIKEQYNYDFSILLNQNSQKNIESIADTLRKKVIRQLSYKKRHVNGASLGVPIIAIATYLGFDCYIGDLSVFKKNLEGYEPLGLLCVSHELIANYETDKIIETSCDISSEEYRWTVAWLLANYLFDFDETKMIDFSSSRIDFENDVQNARDIRNDAFARAMLLPKEEFLKERERLLNKGMTLYELCGKLAEEFGVSTYKVKERLDELKK